MFSEKLKLEFIELINRWTWTSPDLQTQELKPLISKTEFLETLQEALKITFGVTSVFTPITTPQNSTICSEPHTPDINYSYKFLDTLPIEQCDYNTEEVCRSEEKINRTISIEDSLLDSPLIKLDNEADIDVTVIKTAPSSVVYIDQVGRSDTFEIENTRRVEEDDLKLNKTEVFDGVTFTSNKIEKMTKKLEKVQNDISVIANAAVNIAKEIKGIKKQLLQEEANRFGVSRRRSFKSPMVAVTPIMSKSNIPKLSASMRKKSSSFTVIEDNNKLMTPSPNRSSSTNSIPTRKRSPFSRAITQDSGESKVMKNRRFSHIQSTIPKASPNRKKFSS